MYSTGPLIQNTYFEQALKPYCPRGCKRKFLIHHYFLLLAKNIAPVSYFPRFLFPAQYFLLLLTAVIVFSSPFCGRCMCVSACCCTAAVVHPHDPMTKGRGGCRECQSPVHCGTPLLPDADTFRETGRCRISQLYRYVCTVRTDRRPLPVPTSNPSITGSTILIDFLLLRCFLSFFFF